MCLAWIIHKNLLQEHIALKLNELAWITILMYVYTPTPVILRYLIDFKHSMLFHNKVYE